MNESSEFKPNEVNDSGRKEEIDYIDGFETESFWHGRWGEIPLPHLKKLLEDYGKVNWDQSFSSDGQSLNQLYGSTYKGVDKRWFDAQLHQWREKNPEIDKIAKELGLQ